MVVGVAQVAEKLLQVVLVRVGVSVKAEEVELWLVGGALAGSVGWDGGAEGILVCVEENVGTVIFVVTGKDVSLRDCLPDIDSCMYKRS